MKIQLSQPNIEQALKMYLEAQGIKLGLGAIHIAFTAGRKQGGLTADVVFDDAAEPVVAALVFTPRSVAPIAEVTTPISPLDAVAEVAQEEVQEVAVEELVEEVAEVPAKGASLFG